METTITATALAKNLSDVLNRVKYRGERFVIVRNNERMATIGPPPDKPSITLGEFLTLLRELPRPDPEFADDLEAIQASQPPAELTEWPD